MNTINSEYLNYQENNEKNSKIKLEKLFTDISQGLEQSIESANNTHNKVELENILKDLQEKKNDLINQLITDKQKLNDYLQSLESKKIDKVNNIIYKFKQEINDLKQLKENILIQNSDLIKKIAQQGRVDANQKVEDICIGQEFQIFLADMPVLGKLGKRISQKI